MSAFNEAVQDLDVASIDTQASLAASRGSFRILQIVENDDPEVGSTRIVVNVDHGRVSMALLSQGEEPDPAPQVTVMVHRSDAMALAKGDLDPAGALALGAIRVRGDLSVLVAGRAILEAAADRLQPLGAATTD